MLVSELVEAKSDVAALVCAAQDGDRAAFGSLYERYARMVHGVLIAHVGFADAEDLVQDVFMRDAATAFVTRSGGIRRLACCDRKARCNGSAPQAEASPRNSRPIGSGGTGSG